MNYLIVAATVLEVKPLLDRWDLESPTVGEVTVYRRESSSVTFLIGGIGMMSMAFHLGTKLSEQQYDLVLNVGIAGSYKSDLQIGNLVLVKSQTYADLGASSPERFEDFFEMGFLDVDQKPFENKQITCHHTNILKDYDLPEVTGVSVNNVSGIQSQIDIIKEKYQPDIEVMEGISVHYACSFNNIPYLEIRAISNFVEVRNKSNWKVKEAIETLNDFLFEWFTT